MKAYIIRRLLLIIPTFLGISIVLFILVQFLPGGPIENYIAQIRGSLGASGASHFQDITQNEIEILKKTLDTIFLFTNVTSSGSLACCVVTLECLSLISSLFGM